MTTEPKTRFAFDKKRSEIITLDELARSANEQTDNYKPLNGISHIDLLNKIQGMVSSRKIDNHFLPIHACQGGTSQLPGVSTVYSLAEQHGKDAPEAHIIRRVIAGVQMDTYNDPVRGFCPTIAINFHQMGIEIAYGSNVHVCSNLTILGGTHIQSYGKGSTPLDKMFDILDAWINRIDVFSENDKKVYDIMNSITVGPNEIEEIIGEMLVSAVKYNDVKLRSEEKAFNVTQVSSFTRGVINAKKPDLTAWDLLNIGTDILKPHSMDSMEYISQNNVLGAYMMDRFVKEPISYSYELN